MTRLTRALLHALPREYRRRVGEQLCLTWCDGYREHRHRGRASAAGFVWREAWAFAVLVAQTRRQTFSGIWMAVPTHVDLRGAWRQVSARPVSWISSTALLGLAMAGSVVTLALADAVLWRPLPFRDADRLVAIWENGGTSPADVSRVTGWRFEHWRAHAPALTGLAAFGAAGFQVEVADGVTFVRGVRVTGNFFDTLGIEPALGRLLQPHDQAEGATPVVVLSHDYWVTHFGGRATALGDSLRLSGTTYQVVGVLPDVWLPSWPVNPATIRLERDLRSVWIVMPPASTLARNTRSHLFGVIGRLPAGMTPEAAQDMLAPLSAPDDPDPHGAIVRTLRAQMVDTSRTAVIVLALVAGGLVLVAACNLSAAELASHHRRTDEFLVRRALGAGRAALMRLLLAEQGARIVVAAACAAVLTTMTLSALPALVGDSLPLVTMPVLDVRTGTWLVLLALLVGIALMAWPLVRLHRLDRSGLAHVTSRVAAAHGGFGLLLGTQIVGAVALVILAMQLSETMLAITRRDPGFDPRGIRAIELSLPRDRFDSPAAIAAFEDDLVSRLRAGGGAIDVTVSHDHPFTANWLDVATVLGEQTADDTQQQVQLRIVGPEYPEAMRARVVAGRSFDAGIRADWPGQALVNEAFIRERGVTVGQRLQLSSPGREFEIVGVLADERLRGLDADVEPAVYVTTRQFPQTDLTLLARFGDDDPRVDDVPALIRAIEPRVSRGPTRLLTDLEAEQRVDRTLLTSAVGANALGAWVFAIVGLSSLLSLIIAAREREIGIRLALGAQLSTIVRGVLRSVLGPVLWGTAGGVLLALVGGWALRAWLVEATAPSLPVVAAAAGVLLGGAGVSAVAPLHRFRRRDPLQSIRR